MDSRSFMPRAVQRLDTRHDNNALPAEPVDRILPAFFASSLAPIADQTNRSPQTDDPEYA